jgi:hypothetical protein
MSQYSQWDLGACGCPGCGCVPCTLPLGNITATHFTGAVATMAYLGVVAGACKWQGSVVIFGGTVTVTMLCKAACSAFISDLGGGTYALWTSPIDCFGLAAGSTGGFTLVSVCSPLNLQFKNGGSGALVWTLT